MASALPWCSFYPSDLFRALSPWVQLSLTFPNWISPSKCVQRQKSLSFPPNLCIFNRPLFGTLQHPVILRQNPSNTCSWLLLFLIPSKQQVTNVYWFSLLNTALCHLTFSTMFLLFYGRTRRLSPVLLQMPPGQSVFLWSSSPSTLHTPVTALSPRNHSSHAAPPCTIATALLCREWSLKSFRLVGKTLSTYVLPPFSPTVLTPPHPSRPHLSNWAKFLWFPKFSWMMHSCLCAFALAIVSLSIPGSPNAGTLQYLLLFQRVEFFTSLCWHIYLLKGSNLSLCFSPTICTLITLSLLL